jgi:DHA1 family inner membrane transport protein
LPVLASGTFVLGTGEIGVAGLLPAISRDLRVTAGTAGVLISAYALAVALAGPVLTAALRRLPRRRVLTIGLGMLATGHGLTATATSFPVMVAARALTGAGAAVYVAAALTLATALAEPGRRGRAIAVVFGGIGVSMVLGVPLGTLLGNAIGWRAVYGTLTVGSVGVLLAAARLVPWLSVETPATLRRQLSALTHPALLVTFAVNGIVTAGHYTVFTYLVVLLTDQTRLGAGAISAVLLSYGIASIVGNWIGGAAADRSARRTVLVSAALLIVSLCAVPAAMTAAVPMWLVGLGWAAAFSGFCTGAQLRVSLQAGPAADVAAATNISASNTGIAVGSVVGGLILGRAGMTAVCLSAATLVALGLTIALTGNRADPRGPRSISP